MADLLRAAAPECDVEIVHISTIGDRDQTEPLSQLGGFGVFTREVQKALLDGRADLAVHSLKDLPTELVDGLTLAAVPERGPNYDALALPGGVAQSPSADERTETAFSILPPNARVGTGSLRRRAQLLHARPDLQLLEVRGNVETRLRKLDEGQYDALSLAEAGLRRLGLEDRINYVLQPPEFLPAVGQGALGLECRSDDTRLIEILERLCDTVTLAAVTAERRVLADLRAGCHAPLGVHTHHSDGQLHLQAVVLSPDGRERVFAEATGTIDQAHDLGISVAADLLQQGADELIGRPTPE